MNLIICHTPFQMYLFEKILKKYPNEKFHLINYYFSDTQKRRYYFQRISKFCSASEAVFCQNGRSLFFKTYLLSRRLRKKKYDRVFLSSIDSVLCQTVLSSIIFNDLITFDDGLANITPTSVLYLESKTNMMKLADIILRNKYSIKKIKNQSLLHYTIFDAQNIISKVEKINILDFNETSLSSNCSGITLNSQVSVLLGQPLFSTDLENLEFYTELLSNFKIDFYFPHPRETYNIENIKYIQTDLIFEE
ncbi:TPA: glycosyltransferase family 52, partial [Streptococcus suis]